MVDKFRLIAVLFRMIADEENHVSILLKPIILYRLNI